MSKSNPFRPSLDVLESRSLMSASFAPEPILPVPTRVELGHIFVSSATPGGATAGEASVFDLSAVPTDTAQTREHILLARQVGVPAAAHAGVIEIESWSLGTTTEAAGAFHRLFGDADGAR